MAGSNQPSENNVPDDETLEKDRLRIEQQIQEARDLVATARDATQQLDQALAQVGIEEVNAYFESDKCPEDLRQEAEEYIAQQQAAQKEEDDQAVKDVLTRQSGKGSRPRRRFRGNRI